MHASIAAVLTLVAGIGTWLIITGTRPSTSPPSRRRPSLSTLQRKQRAALVLALVLGIILWLITGFIVTVIAVPVLVYITPHLLPHSTGKHAIARLDAMAEWTRSLSGLLGASAAIEPAIIASRNSAPAALREDIRMLAARLEAGVPIERALTHFGDDLADPTGDILTGALLLGSRHRGAGLTRILTGTAQTIADDVAARRQIEADRAKPRSTARLITVIAVAVIAAEFILNPTYVEPYQSPLGQIILIVLVAVFLAALWWMNAITREPKGQRFLSSAGGATP